MTAPRSTAPKKTTATRRTTKPQDRRAPAAKAPANAARAEAIKAGITFTYDGVEYVVGPEAATDLELFEAVEDQRYIAACRGYIGKPQWEAFKERHRGEGGRIDVASMEGLMQALMDALGNS